MRKIVLLFVLMAFVCADEVQQEGSEIILEISITDYIKIINCLLAQESLMKDVTELIEMIKTQDFTKLIELAIRLYTDGTAAIKVCLSRLLEQSKTVKLTLPRERCIEICGAPSFENTCYQFCIRT